MLSSRNNPSSVIFGCAGYSLTPEEKDFFTNSNPLGFILFKRNVQDKAQLKSLIEELKATVPHSDPSILIDQEGGRVARLKPPFWKAYPPPRVDLSKESLEDAKILIYQTYTSIAKELRELGITVNCAPVLDLDVPGADPIMGDRTFSHDPSLVAALGAIAIKAHMDNGIIPIMKHLPGHGAATADSHETLPIVDISLQDLAPHFAPFKFNKECPWGMTAHIVYSALDPHHPATQSRLIIQDIIRGELGFRGFLVSDDLGMKALSGSFAERARKSLEAGCNAVLHCSGILAEMHEVMEGI